MELNKLEREVMGKLLDGDDETLVVLRRQLREATVLTREMTGAGFMTTFGVPPTTARLSGSKSFRFGDVVGSCDGLEHGMGFVLYVSGGAIECLEGYSYDEPWPESIDRVQLSYVTGEVRDFVGLSKKWN